MCLYVVLQHWKSLEGVDGANAVGRTVSKDCYKELFVFLMDESTNINKDIPMAKACKKDVKKHCKNEPAGSTVSAPYISCLREVKDELTPSCEKHVYQAMYMATKDFRLEVASGVLSGAP